MGRKREIPYKIRLTIFKKYNGKCAECKTPSTQGIGIFNGKERAYLGNLEIHHIHPYIKGGKHTEDNLILLCGNCHKKKHSRGAAS